LPAFDACRSVLWNLKIQGESEGRRYSENQGVQSVKSFEATTVNDLDNLRGKLVGQFHIEVDAKNLCRFLI
jgi:hypothetical protein